jgi:hypothetical protein
MSAYYTSFYPPGYLGVVSERLSAAFPLARYGAQALLKVAA